jgi:uncharacterized protein
MRIRFIFFLACFFINVSGFAQKGQVKPKTGNNEITYIVKSDVLVPAPYGGVKIGGYLGTRMDLCIDNRVMAQELKRIVDPLTVKNDGTSHGWRGMFWGEWMTSAMFSCAYSPTAEHKAIVDKGVDEVLKVQMPSGYIGSYPDDQHLGEWDLWDRKYVLLGLLSYYDQNKSPKVLEAAKKEADLLVAETGPQTNINISESGWGGWKGLPPSSILEPMALLYQRTGEKRYLDFCEYVIKLWDSPNKLSPTGLRLVQEAISGTPMWKMSGSPKAYEMMSCYEGLCEMYRATGNALYLKACEKLVDNILRDEAMIIGPGSITEIWCNSKMKQSGIMTTGIETCVTVTWIKFLYQMLRLTGDSEYADQMEIALYNALLAAMTPKGDWWSYFTSLMGDRIPSNTQGDDVLISCCVGNGPRALMLTPSWAVMTCEEGVVLNLYNQMSATIKTPSGQQVSLQLNTDYPVNGDVAAIISLSKPEEFSLKLRIPKWSKNTIIKINGEDYKGYIIQGTYSTIKRKWSGNDKVEISFDFRAHVEKDPAGTTTAAIVRGPIVLAFDSRMVPDQHTPKPPMMPMYRFEFMKNYEDESIDLELDKNTNNPLIWMTFKVPCKDEAGLKHYVPMCDFASAGNLWDPKNVMRTWIEQPFDFRHIYPMSYHLINGNVRPSIPSIYKK